VKTSRNKPRIPGEFVWVLLSTLSSPAWRALSHGARSLFLHLSRRYNLKNNNNGKIYLSTRGAAAELGSGREEIANWFRELEFYGFIVKTQPGYLGVNGCGLAPHWRMTDRDTESSPPTWDFLNWNGTKFRRRKRRPSRQPSSSVTAIDSSGVEAVTTKH